MKNITLVGIDLAKNVFQVHAEDSDGNKIHSKRLSRAKFIEYLSKLPSCLIGMEACGSAHYWARHVQSLGHKVKVINPKIIKAFVIRNKTDAKDAEAIAEATRSNKIKSITIKTLNQQHLTSLHKARSLLVKKRTQLVNHIRSQLAEYGLIASKGYASLDCLVTEVLAKEYDIFDDEMLFIFQDLYDEWHELNKRIETYDKKVKKQAKSHEKTRKLLAIPGLGPITATAVIAKFDNIECFNKAKDFSASLGLTPKEHSSANTRHLGKISKQGDRYLRTLLSHGARASLRAIKKTSIEQKNSAYHQWARNTLGRIGFNKTATALANKHARIIWAMLKHDNEQFDLEHAAQYN